MCNKTAHLRESGGVNERTFTKGVVNVDTSIISRAEHDEFCRRLEAEHKRLTAEDNRQNHRLDTLEEKVEQIGALVTSVEKLALNMEIMANELKQQGERLESLEARDGENWRKAVGHIVTVVIGAMIGFICTRIGL